MRQIIDFLRKMGVLRTSSGDYATGEYASRKDLKKNKVPIASAKGRKSTVAMAGLATVAGIGGGLMILFWILVVIVVIFLLSIFVGYGFSFWFLVFSVIWFFFFKNFRLQVLASKLATVKMIIIFVILFFVSMMFLLPSDDSSSSFSKKSSQNESGSDLIEVSQAQFSGFVFGTDVKGGTGKINTVHLSINPIVTFNMSSFEDVKMESFEIKNLEFTKKPAVGEVKRIAPKHVKVSNCRGFYFDSCDGKTKPDQVKDDGKDISYEVVKSEVGLVEPEYYDQVFSDNYIKPEFKVIIHNIGKFDYDEIMDKYKVVSGQKYAEYAGIEAKDLASVLEFDVVAMMSNGEKFKKHFVTKFDGADLIKEQTVMAEY